MNNDDALLAEHAQAVRQMFERIPFNLVLGIELDEISAERVIMHLSMKDELVGNFVHGILHGGVIASLLDVAGGAMAMVGAMDKHRHLHAPERAAQLAPGYHRSAYRLSAPRAGPALYRDRHVAAFR